MKYIILDLLYIVSFKFAICHKEQEQTEVAPQITLRTLGYNELYTDFSFIDVWENKPYKKEQFDGKPSEIYFLNHYNEALINKCYGQHDVTAFRGIYETNSTEDGGFVEDEEIAECEEFKINEKFVDKIKEVVEICLTNKKASKGEKDDWKLIVEERIGEGIVFTYEDENFRRLLFITPAEKTYLSFQEDEFVIAEPKEKYSFNEKEFVILDYSRTKFLRKRTFKTKEDIMRFYKDIGKTMIDITMNNKLVIDLSSVFFVETFYNDKIHIKILGVFNAINIYELTSNINEYTIYTDCEIIKGTSEVVTESNMIFAFGIRLAEFVFDRQTFIKLINSGADTRRWQEYIQEYLNDLNLNEIYDNFLKNLVLFFNPDIRQQYTCRGVYRRFRLD